MSTTPTNPLDEKEQPATNVEKIATDGNDNKSDHDATDISMNVWDADETILTSQIDQEQSNTELQCYDTIERETKSATNDLHYDEKILNLSVPFPKEENGEEGNYFIDEENGLMMTSLSDLSTTAEEEQRFQSTCRFVISFGQAAYKYGAVSYHVETFMKELMETFGYKGLFGIWNTEMMCAFTDSNNNQVIRMEVLEGGRGFNLHKLSLLNDVAKNVIQGTTTPYEAMQAWDEIAQEPDPWGFWTTMVCWVLTSAGIPGILRGGWWDCLGGAICSIPIFILTTKLPDQYQEGVPFISAFLAAIIASVGKVYLLPDVNVAMVVISATIVEIPGYDVSLACSELLSSHILAGLDRLIHAFVVMVMLVGGGWLGSRWWGEDIVLSFPDPDSPDAIPLVWQGLFGPVLMICLCILFQVSRKDILWPFLSLVIAYLSFLVGSMVIGDDNIGVLLASTLATLYSQVWARWFNRPRTIVILPTLVLLVSGSIGFRGLMQWTEGEKVDGLAQVTQMFVVAFLIIAGLVLGSSLVKADTTL